MNTGWAAIWPVVSLKLVNKGWCSANCSPFSLSCIQNLWTPLSHFETRYNCRKTLFCNGWHNFFFFATLHYFVLFYLIKSQQCSLVSWGLMQQNEEKSSREFMSQISGELETELAWAYLVWAVLIKGRKIAWQLPFKCHNSGKPARHLLAHVYRDLRNL